MNGGPVITILNQRFVDRHNILAIASQLTVCFCGFGYISEIQTAEK